MSPTARHRRRGTRRAWVGACIAVAVVLAAASAALVVAHDDSGVAAATAQHRSPGRRAPITLTVASVVPAAGTTAPPDSPVTVRFDAPLAPDSALPSLTPAVAGSWTRLDARTVTFIPQTTLPPGGTVTVTVPGGPTGATSTAGGHLVQAAQTSFAVAPMSTLRVQQLLAELGYLPLTFTPSDPAPVPPTALGIDQGGTFTWKWSTLPAVLTSQWAPGQPNVLTRGAIMAFEDQHGLATDGIAGPKVWSALIAAAAADQGNSYGHWDWVDVTTSLPETVSVWRDGAVVYQTPGNTGVPGAATATGTYPVYERFQVTTMTGTNPDGSHYSDPGIPWVSYFNGGDALHGFVRASYGFPQSDGCVEMPPSNAAVVWPYTPIGTLVTVQ